MCAPLIIQTISKYITLDKAEMAYFVSLLRPKSIKKKAYLLRPGDISKSQNFVLQGCLRSFSVDEQGVDRSSYFALEGGWINDVYSYFSGKPATNYVEALEDSEVLQISKTDLEKLYLEVPKFERYFRILYQNALMANIQYRIQARSSSAEQRYLWLCAEYPELEQRIAQKHIATYLGITPEFLSMIRRRIAGR